MKKSLSVHISYLVSLLFFAAIVLVASGNEVRAQTAFTCGGGSTTATDSGGKQCSTYTTAATCAAATPCIWSATVTGDSNNNAFVNTMCNVLKIVTGNGGKAFAAFAIISLGIGFFTGKVSWGLMIGVACGIAAMFGAPTIVAAIGGGSAFNCGS
jgi:type IV secretory pathway VirB2 component (pilin)